MSAARGPGYWLAIAAGAVVVAAVVAAFVVMGPPAAQREARLDARRVQDLQRLAGGIESHARLHDALPAALATLAAQPGARWPTHDPATGAPYGYAVTGKRSFRLCAVFATDTARAPGDAAPWGGDEWSHAVGERCFDRKLEAAASGR
ncbi:MAG TPA: hypothetical protein VM619_03495 [Luteimonas sp.]|nr:hypothetical protein [Luteimonas sp.]